MLRVLASLSVDWFSAIIAVRWREKSLPMPAQAMKGEKVLPDLTDDTTHELPVGSPQRQQKFDITRLCYTFILELTVFVFPCDIQKVVEFCPRYDVLCIFIE